jgi:hypothetical protein
LPASSVIATWQISPRQPSTSDTTMLSAIREGTFTWSAPSGSSWSSSRMKRIEFWISSQRTYARAKTSPVLHVHIGTWL